MRNLDDLRNWLRTNLDDSTKTGWTDAQLTVLLNNSLQWLVGIADAHDSFYRILEAPIAVAAGDTTVKLQIEGVRKILLIERTSDNERIQGKLVNYRQRNQYANRYNNCGTFYMYQVFNGNTGKFNLSFVDIAGASEAWTLTVSYAPPVQLLINNGSTVVDINEEHLNTLVLRATLQGYGGEKNADAFWLQQYRDALANTEMSLESPNRDGVETMTLVDDIDGFY